MARKESVMCDGVNGRAGTPEYRAKEEKRAMPRNRERGVILCQAYDFCSREIYDGFPEEAVCWREAVGGIGYLVVLVGFPWAPGAREHRK